MAFKTEAIVLHGRNLKGADRIYEILTPNEGKLSVVARSAGKSSSKLSGSLQPFAHVLLMIGRGRQDHVAGVRMISSHRILHESWFDFILTTSLVELTMRLNVQGQAAQQEFDLLRTTLQFIAVEAYNQREKVLIGRIFLWKLLALSGWKPNLDQCAECHAKLGTTDVYYRPVTGFVCMEHGREGVQLHDDMLPFLEYVVVSTDWSELIRQAGTNGLQKQWLKVSQQYYKDVVSYPIESLKLFEYVS